MRQGTSEEGMELCMDGARGREEASGGEREQRREIEEQLREDRRRKGDRETSREVPCRTLANILILYSAQNYTQRGPCP